MTTHRIDDALRYCATSAQRYAPHTEPETRQRTVLLVDDEPHVLAGLRRVFHKEPYALLCATSVEQAFVYLRAKTVDVVISDHDMPGMRGTAFLAKVRHEFPETIRFMLTGKPTLEVAIQAINEGAIHRFFTKPCNHFDLLLTLRQALQQHDLLVAAKCLLRAVRSQSAELAQLERHYPGITSVRRDEGGVIVAEPDEMSLEELVAQLRRETAKVTVRSGGRAGGHPQRRAVVPRDGLERTRPAGLEGKGNAGMTEKILCVDDEVNILDGLKRQLHKRFVLETAVSGAEGLALLDGQGPFAVVVSDMRMPGMHGAQFLALVRERTPDCVRIMLTGQTDVTAAIAAVNEGHVFRFLTKPCATESLVTTLEAALEQYRLVTTERTLLEKTLHGSVKVLTEVLALINPVAFGQASRLKRYVCHIATHLALPDVWQYELAALLSPLGCVTLPMETLEKSYAGQALSAEEQRLFAAHPAVGSALLRHIPRLETVAAMIAKQLDPGDTRERLQERPQGDPVLLGAQLLKIALDFDQRITRGLSYRRAIAEMLQQPALYESRLVASLKTLEAVETDTVIRTVGVCDLFPGMILAEDIRTTTGGLVLAKGHEVTVALIERLRSYGKRVDIGEPFRVLVQGHLGG